MKKKINLREQEVYIDNDWTKGEKEMRAIIRKRAKEERKQENKVKIFYNTAVMKRDIWNLPNTKQIMP